MLKERHEADGVILVFISIAMVTQNIITWKKLLILQ